MQVMILATLAVLGTAAAIWFGTPPPTPDLWPIAWGLIAAGLCGLLSTLSWCFVQLKRLNRQQKGNDK